MRLRLSNAIGSPCARLDFSSKRFRRQLKLAAGIALSYRHFRGRFSLEECALPLCEIFFDVFSHLSDRVGFLGGTLLSCAGVLVLGLGFVVVGHLVDRVRGRLSR